MFTQLSPLSWRSLGTAVSHSKADKGNTSEEGLKRQKKATHKVGGETTATRGKLGLHARHDGL